MAKSIEALVTSDILIWARQTIGLSGDIVSEKLEVKEDELEAWETGKSRPSISQLRKLANLYKRPFSCFYLPKRPEETSPPKDFRRIHPESSFKSVSSINLAIRNAQLYRENTEELFARGKREIPQFKLTGIADVTAHELAKHLRDQLRVNFNEQSSWHDTRLAFRFWRELLERHGILTYQFTDVDSRDARGFSLFFEKFPVIAVNAHESPAGRIFTIFHELAHLIERQSGLCDIHEDEARAPAAQRAEVFCNAVSGNFLVPETHLHQAIVDRNFSIAKIDLGLSRLSKTFSVSRFVILRRLLDCNVVPKAFYDEHYGRLLREFRHQEDKEKERMADREIRISAANNVVSGYGLRYVGLVLQQYKADSISLKSAAEYFNAKPKHLERIESMFQSRLLNRGESD